ncbi:MAG: hypothetical protein ACLU30_16965 [Odoribacter splanchnicus]
MTPNPIICFSGTNHKVTGKNKEFRPGDTSQCVWEEKGIPHHFRLLPEPFHITWNKDTDSYDIDIYNQDSSFFCYLINASRVQRQTELEIRLKTKIRIPEKIPAGT